MAFNKKLLSKIQSGNAREQGIQLWTYKDKTVDTLATITASGFFDDFSGLLNVDDLLFLVGTDDHMQARVTAVSPNVTVEEYIVAAVADNSISTVKLQDGAVTNPKIGPDAVNGDKIADGSISLEHLDSGIQMNAVIWASGIHTQNISGTTVTIPVAGAVVTDIVFTGLMSTNAPAGTHLVESKVIAPDAITVVLSQSLTTNDVEISYQIIRTAT